MLPGYSMRVPERPNCFRTLAHITKDTGGTDAQYFERMTGPVYPGGSRLGDR